MPFDLSLSKNVGRVRTAYPALVVSPYLAMIAQYYNRDIQEDWFPVAWDKADPLPSIIVMSMIRATAI